MFLVKKIVIIILSLFATLDAKELNVVFSYSTPPYVFKDGSGIVASIVEESLAYKKHTLKPVFVNIGRSFEMFKHGYVDATSIIKKTSGLEAYYSDYFMQYHNAAFALKSKHYNIGKIEDLSDYNFIAFQNACKYLGETFEKVTIKADKKYSEVADQKQQVYMLLKDRIDIIVMDRHIFQFYKNELISEGKIEKNIQTTLYELFEPTQYRTAFKDEKLRDDFNEGVKYLKSSGRYEQIYNEYSNKYFKIKR